MDPEEHKSQSTSKGKDLPGAVLVMPFGLESAIRKRVSGEFKSERSGTSMTFSQTSNNQTIQSQSFDSAESGIITAVSQIASSPGIFGQASSKSAKTEFNSVKTTAVSQVASSSGVFGQASSKLAKTEFNSSMKIQKQEELTKQKQHQMAETQQQMISSSQHGEEIKDENHRTRLQSALTDLEKEIGPGYEHQIMSPTPSNGNGNNVFSPPPLERISPPEKDNFAVSSIESPISNGHSKEHKVVNFEIPKMLVDERNGTYEERHGTYEEQHGTYEERQGTYEEASYFTQESGSSSSMLQKIMTPATQEYESGSLKKRDPKKMFTDSSFYSAAHHPTVADQVELAYKLSSALSNEDNTSDKGQQMYLNRAKRSGETIDDEVFAPRHDAPNLKLVMNPEGKVQEWADIAGEDLHNEQAVATHATAAPLPGAGKGGRLFAKRQKKAENWVVDENTVGQDKPSNFADKFMQKQTFQQQQFQQSQQAEQEQKQLINQQQQQEQQEIAFCNQQESQHQFQEQSSSKQSQSLEIRRQQELQQATMNQQQIELPANFQHCTLINGSNTPSFDTSCHNSQGINVWANTAPRGWASSGTTHRVAGQGTMQLNKSAVPPMVSVCPATPHIIGGRNQQEEQQMIEQKEINQQRMEEQRIEIKKKEQEEREQQGPFSVVMAEERIELQRMEQQQAEQEKKQLIHQHYQQQQQVEEEKMQLIHQQYQQQQDDDVKHQMESQRINGRMEKEKIEIQRMEQEQAEQEQKEKMEQYQMDQYRIEEENIKIQRMEMEKIELQRMEQQLAEQEQMEHQMGRMEQHPMEQEIDFCNQQESQHQFQQMERMEQHQMEQQRMEEKKNKIKRMELKQMEQERMEQQTMAEKKIKLQRMEQQAMEQQRMEEQRQIEQQRMEQQVMEQNGMLQRIEKQSMEEQRMEQQRMEQEKYNSQRMEQQQLVQQHRMEQQKIEQQRMEQQAKTSKGKSMKMSSQTSSSKTSNMMMGASQDDLEPQKRREYEAWFKNQEKEALEYSACVKYQEKGSEIHEMTTTTTTQNLFQQQQHQQQQLVHTSQMQGDFQSLGMTETPSVQCCPIPLAKPLAEPPLPSTQQNSMSQKSSQSFATREVAKGKDYTRAADEAGYTGSLHPTTTGDNIRQGGDVVFTQARSESAERRNIRDSGLFGGISGDNNSLVDDTEYQKISVKNLVGHFSKVKPKTDISAQILPQQHNIGTGAAPSLNYLSMEQNQKQESTKTMQKHQSSTSVTSYQSQQVQSSSVVQQIASHHKTQEENSTSTVRRQSLKDYLLMDPATEHMNAGIIDPSAILRDSDATNARSGSEGILLQSSIQGSSDNLTNKWDNHNAIARGWGGIKEKYHPVTFREIYNVDSQAPGTSHNL